MNQAPILDSVGFFVLIASAIFSAEVAALVGPYMVIISASAIGASFALIRRTTGTRLSAVWFFLRICGVATLLTVGIASLLSTMHPDLTPRILIAPVALGFGLAGDDLPSVFTWVVRKLVRVAETILMKTGGKSE